VNIIQPRPSESGKSCGQSCPIDSPDTFQETAKSMKNDVTLYQAFGFTISSELKLPPLPLAKDQHAKPDINITVGPVDRTGLQNPAMDEEWYQASPMQFWMYIDDIAWFMVTNGNSIVIDPEEGADEQTIRLYLLGSCMGVILHQRKFLVIHGNAIRFGDQCVVFAGPSGAGKSTLAAAFHQRGHDILADDVCAIDAEGRAVPSFPQLKLWHDAAEKLEINTSDLERIRVEVKKFAFPLQQSLPAPIPVAAVYILSSNNKGTFEIKTIDGMKKFESLMDNTYRMLFLDGLGLKPAHFQLCSQLAGRIHMACISRPDSSFELNKLVDFILADLQDKGIAVS